MQNKTESSNETKQARIVVIGICVCFLGALATCGHYNQQQEETRREAFRQGYIETATPGSYGVHWEKAVEK
jgi:hypothetical protein